MPYVLGTDVHAGYYAVEPIDFAAVKASGREFVIAKHTQGNDPHKDDGTFWRTIEAAQEVGLICGRYHYAYNLPEHDAHPGRSPIEEAERSWKKSRGFGSRKGELPPLIDAEHLSPDEWPAWGCSPMQISAWLRDHCDATAQRWGRKPIIYTYPAWWVFLETHADVSWAREYLLWIASAGALHKEAPDEGQQPHAFLGLRGYPQVKTWDTWTFWQYGFDGSEMTIPGITAKPVDRDCFNGSLADLRKLAGLDEIEAPPKTLKDWLTVHPDVVLDPPPSPYE